MIQPKSLEWIETAPERSKTLPARYFYDPAVFAAERERIFHPAWHCVGHASELAEPGQFVTFDILDQSVIVSNDAGTLHAFHNACQHRGNRLTGARRG
jgi:choline monooxygenase